MIIDSLENSGGISALHPRFKKVFDYLNQQELVTLPVGKIELEGDSLWLNVDVVTGREASEALLESHDKYIDIQIPLTREEIFGWQGRDRLNRPMNGGYQVEKDITFYQDDPGMYFTLHPGNFVVFFPADAHAPCIGQGSMKKIVAKVRM